jgi:asparagine synthase (glutamine-hydrolysing)
LISNEKLGFSVDTINLWKSIGHKICTNYLKNGRIVNDHWINKKWIDRYIDQENLDIRYINKFLGLLAFEIWYRIFVTKEMNENTELN